MRTHIIILALVAIFHTSLALAQAPAAFAPIRTGDVATLRALLKADPKAATAADATGWTPLHEAARYTEVDTRRHVEFVMAEASRLGKAGRPKEAHDLMENEVWDIDNTWPRVLGGRVSPETQA